MVTDPAGTGSEPGVPVAGVSLDRALRCCLAGALALGLGWSHQPANAVVFGDGDSANGPEDDRMELAKASRWSGAGQPSSWPQSAGTIYCAGQVRGSALVLEPAAPQATDQAANPDGSGEGVAFILTAAHVLLDPATGSPFAACEFHFMGLGAIPGYQVSLDPEWIRSGDFDASAPRASAAFGRHDWAFIYLPRGRTAGARPGRWPLRDAAEFLGRPDVRFHLVAWARETGRIAVSGPCRVVMSGQADIGRGGWRGHLLDDCDSTEGASGGGLLASTAEGTYLIGIRLGSHHDPVRYPSGPPPGEAWSVKINSNFARAVDPELIAAFRGLVRDSEIRGRTGRPLAPSRLVSDSISP